ncbi:MAG: lamin tail domain-containing protein [Thermoplasmata archaeon]
MDGYRNRDVELDRMRRKRASDERTASTLGRPEQKDRSIDIGNGRKTNGFVNGFSRNGRINGLTNGLTNGIRNARIGLYNGLVNGLERKTGLINGNGFINGFRLSSLPRKLPLRRRKPGVRIAASLALSAIVIIVPFLLIFSMPTSAIKIDGYFFDWDRAGYIIEDYPTADAMIDIRQYSMVRWNDVVYCYIATTGKTFSQGNSTPVGFYAMIDLDNNRSTGYSVGDIGADRMIEILGWNGTAQSAQVYIFSETGNSSDFNSFMPDGMADIASSVNKMEFSFVENTGSDPIIRFFSKSCHGCQDISQFAIKYNKPAVRAVAQLEMPSVILPELREKVMDISIVSKKGNAQLAELKFKQLGNATDYRLLVYDGDELIGQSVTDTIRIEPSVPLIEGYAKTLHVFAIVGEGQNTSSFGLSLVANNMTRNGASVVVEERQTGSKVSYIAGIPDRIVIDGAFADWKNGYVTEDPVGDVRFINSTIGKDPAIDITEYGMYSNGTHVAMYVAVVDNIANGTYLPKDIALPIPSQGLPPTESPELIGADIAGVILDTDMNISTGANATNLMGADYLVFIAGKKGKILNSDIYRWEGAQDSGEWVVAGAVQFAIDARRLEFAFNMSLIGLGELDVATVAFFMTDWKEGMDISDSILPLAKWQSDMYSRAFGGIIINEVYNVKNQADWVELYNTGTTPISLSGWRLYDGSRLIAVLPDIVLQPGDFYVITGLNFNKIVTLSLYDSLGNLQDSVKVPEMNQPKSWARTGDPPYDKWKWANPTPGDLNPGQIAIPEFSNIIIPILAVGAFFVLGRMRKRKGSNGGR